MCRVLFTSAIRFSLSILLVASMSACSSYSERMIDAAGRAAIHPATWLPAAGALALQVDDWDKNLADWATDHNPIFGKESTADSAGDILTVGLAASAVGTGLFTEKTSAYSELIADGTALGSSAVATLGLKSMIDRNRPDESNRDSFPSGHTALSVSGAVLTCNHLDRMNISPATRNVAKGSAIVAASLAGWSRIEAGEHYPSDVLAGAALGNFLTRVAHDTFLPDQEASPQLSIDPADNGWVVGLSFNY